jgi:osmotically-inducible protein OsmY
MANGTYSQSGGYRNDRARDERDASRETRSFRSGDTGQTRGFGDYERSGDNVFAGRDFGHDDEDRSRFSRYGRGSQWASDDFGYEGRHGDNERSDLWARESYRGKPSTLNYEPGQSRDRYDQPFGDRYGSGSDDRSGSGRYGSDQRSGYRSGSSYESDYGRKRGFMERAGDEVASWFGDEAAEQRRAMDEHRGKGPRGYKRSDPRIEEDVNDRLSDDPMLDASNISVTVKDGEVTLDGFVTSRLDKRRAEDLTDDVSGVKHVQNNLRVGNSSSEIVSGSTTV